MLLQIERNLKKSKKKFEKSIYVDSSGCVGFIESVSGVNSQMCCQNEKMQMAVSCVLQDVLSACILLDAIDIRLRMIMDNEVTVQKLAI